MRQIISILQIILFTSTHQDEKRLPTYPYVKKGGLRLD